MTFLQRHKVTLLAVLAMLCAGPLVSLAAEMTITGPDPLGGSVRRAKVDGQGGLAVSLAASTSAVATEVLVLNSAAVSVPTTPLSGRRAVEINNIGANPIYCTLGGGVPVVAKARRIAANEAWAFDATEAIVAKCIAGTADQTTGAATIVTELK